MDHTVQVGDELAEVSDLITRRRVVMNPGVTLDYYPGHWDPETAKAQGQRDIFINTMHFMGFVDRVALEWAGWSSRLLRRKIKMQNSICAGDTMIASGSVREVEVVDGATRVHIDLWIRNQDDVPCCFADITIELGAVSSDA